MPKCRRERDRCLGSCGGNASLIEQDFMTFASKVELSSRVLGLDRLAAGRANCTAYSHTLDIDLFDGMGEAWIKYDSRLRVRGGFTALDPRACRLHPEACAAVQRVLEKDPTLTYNAKTGRFVPAHSINPPLPPPLPSPPPLFVLYQTPPPPPHPPVPSPPPPWHAHSELCFPVVTAAETGIEVADGLERALCVYVRAIENERVRADKCFASISPSPPPPPPTPTSHLAALATSNLKRLVRLGGSNSAVRPKPLTDTEQYAADALVQQEAQLAYLDTLSDDNFQLRDLLGGIRDKIEGRRLWQRNHGHTSHKLVDNVLATVAFGTAPLSGVTMSECQALCRALENNTIGTCTAVAFARNSADPRCVPFTRTHYSLPLHPHLPTENSHFSPSTFAP